MSEDSRSGRLRGPLVIVNPDEGDSLRAHNGRGTGPRPPNPKQQPKPADYDPHPYSDPARSPSSPPSTPSISSLFKIPTDPSPSSFYPPTSIPNNDRTNSDGTYTRKSMNNYPRPPLGGRPLPPVSRKSRTSPTSQDPQPSRAASSASSGRLIMVTTDSERFVMVDLSGATTAAQMRELILSKLQIFNEDENNPYSIFQTEIGEYAIGEALSDSRLFTLCRDVGDGKGTLKFLVTHPFAPVHEPPPPTQSSDYTMPPAYPKVPIIGLRTRPRQSSGSRNGSISSSSEILTPEMGTGYEADLENPDREPRSTKSSQSHIPASPPKQASPPRRPSIASQPRSGSPDQPPSPLPAPDRRMNMRKEERQGHSLPPIPMIPPPIPMAPPLSPNRSSFPSHDDLSPSLSIPWDRKRHGRSGSDAGADQEYSSRIHDHYVENNARLRRDHHHPSLQQLRSQDSRELLRTQQRRVYEDDDTGQEIILPNGVRADELERNSPTYRRRNQPPYSQRPVSPFTQRSHLPPNPTRPPPMPPLVPSSSTTRTLPKHRPILPVGGTLIGQNMAFKTYLGETRPSTSSSSYSHSSRLTKQMTKSVGDLKSLAGQGSSRRTPVTPQLPILSNANNRDVAYSPSSSLYSSAMPKPYDSRNGVRPLPPNRSLPSGNAPESLQGSSSQFSSARGLSSTLVSPSYDPYPRPQSAAGETISPTRGYSHSRLQSPTAIYGSNLDSGDYNRSPRTVSPNRSHHSPGSMTGPRPRPTAAHSDRSSDPSGAENSNTPPLTPQDPQQDERGYVDPSPPLSPRGIIDKEQSSGSELTLKEDGQKYFASLLKAATATPTGTVVASSHTKRLSTELKRDGSSDEYEDEDSYIGSGTWIVRPETGRSGSRPPLKVQIEPPTNGTVEQDARPEPLPKDSQPSSFRPGTSAINPNLLRVQSKRPESTFIDPDSDNWAPRPPPENIYEELEKFFPKHDLDKPVIEATSGETSPTNAEPVAALPPVSISDEKARIKAKKSIRIVAQEHKKRIDRTSRAADTISQKDSMMRKRSTKLWGSRLEEVTTLQVRNNSSISLPESPSGGPTTFKWVRGELIGKGTYGRVYLALNATTGEMIAVKQVELPQTASDKNDSRQHTVVQALKMESETLRDLDHPNIVQYLGFEETPANLSIFLEYVPGGSVGSCLHKHGKFADNVTRSFTSQILGGLEYLHSKGILHRDMKADNILVEMSGICKISDFGISKRTEDLQGGAFTAMQGTVFWMAPEVVNAQKTGYNFKVDIWSLGCVVLEMWAGMRPWTGEEMVAVMFKLYQSKQPPPVPEDVVLGEDADDFRRKCFAINPEERPSAAELRRHPYLNTPQGWVFTGFT